MCSSKPLSQKVLIITHRSKRANLVSKYQIGKNERLVELRPCLLKDNLAIQLEEARNGKSILCWIYKLTKSSTILEFSSIKYFCENIKQLGSGPNKRLDFRGEGPQIIVLNTIAVELVSTTQIQSTACSFEVASLKPSFL